MFMFVYGTLKRGYNNNDFMSNSTFIGEAVTTDAIYNIRSVSNKGGFPVVDMAGKDKILGELWNVSEKDIPDIDRLEGNGRMYTRKQVSVTIDNKTVIAWMYIFNHKINYDYTYGINTVNGVSSWNRVN